MLVKVVRLLKGYVKFEAKGKFPERFLNLTARYGVNIWDAVPCENGLKASMSIFDYRNVRKIARKSKVVTKIYEKHGIPFFVHKYRFRFGLIIGAILGTVILLVLNNFIWAVNVSGEKNLSDFYVKEVLKENGISVGVYKNNLNVQSVERNTTMKIKDIGWMSINIIGTTAFVELRENTEKPQIIDIESPCNIKAASDGVITKIEARNGVAKVLEGSGVRKGDLLISGIIETKQETMRYVHSDADVYADVICDNEILLPKKFNYYSLTENMFKHNRCSFLWFDFPCTIDFLYGNNFICEYRNECLHLNGTSLPFEVNKRKSIEYNVQNIIPDKDKAQKILFNDILLYEIFEKPDSIVKSRKISILNDKDYYSSNTTYIFNENIAKEVNFKVTQ